MKNPNLKGESFEPSNGLGRYKCKRELFRSLFLHNTSWKKCENSVICSLYVEDVTGVGILYEIYETSLGSFHKFHIK